MKSRAFSTTDTHAVFEVFNLPFTSHDLLESSHSPSGPVRMGGA